MGYVVAAVAVAGLQILVDALRKPAASKPAGAAGPNSSIPAIPGGVPVAGFEIRFVAGYQGAKCIDSMDREWLDDRYFTGGALRLRPLRRVYRTRSPELYLPAREGDFRYAIPLAPCVYELHLHLAEVLAEEADLDSGGERTRSFNVLLNGERILRNFDIVADAGGPNIAEERVFKGVSSGSDGFLRLEFSSVFNKASLSGIEVLPGTPGKMRPMRIRAAERASYDSAGNLWGPDRYFLGGRITRRAVTVQGTPDSLLYGSERRGHFTYAIPVAQGRYRLTLKFVETQARASPLKSLAGFGSQKPAVISQNGRAGGVNRALYKVFHGLTATAQGKLALTFVPVENYAMINPILVEDES